VGDKLLTDTSTGKVDPAPTIETAESTSRNPAKPFAVVIVVVTLLIAGWYAAADRYAPSTSRGVVSANVVQIAARVAGRVTDIAVSDNEIVSAGDLLFQIDERPFVIAVEKARAQLAQATQSLDASSAQLAAAYAKVAQARAAFENVQSESARVRTLAERGQVSDASLEASQTQLASAQADLDAAQAQALSAERSVGVVGADNPQIKAAQLALEQAEYDLLSTKVTAPTRGVVTNLRLGLGQFVGAGQPALTFIEDEGVWVTAEFRENQLGGIDPGDPVTMVFDAAPGQVFEGSVQSIGWGINLGRAEVGGLPVNAPSTQWFEPARRMPVRIELDGGIDAWPRKARVGGSVSVVVHSDGGGVVSSVASGLQRVQSFLTALY
jgi:multidrug resistance efflux pump